MAASADWSLQSSAQIFARTESNPRMLEDDSRSAQAGVADVSMNLLRRTELIDLALNARGSISRYTRDVSLDRDDQQADLILRRRGERYSLMATVSATRDTTLTSELGTTGIVQDNQRHNSLSATLAPSWQISELTSAGVTTAWQQSQYAKTLQTPLVDYQYRSGGLNVQHQYSEQTSVALLADVGRLSSSGRAFDTDNVDLSLRAQHVWSPRWQGALSVGASRVKTEGRSSNGSVFNATLTRQAERVAVDAMLSRSIAPTGRGLLSRRDQAGLQLRVSLLENLDGTVNFNLLRSRDYVPRFGFSLNDVRYTRAELSLAWRFSRDWSLGVAAGHSDQKFLINNLGGENLDARLQLTWRRTTPVG